MRHDFLIIARAKKKESVVEIEQLNQNKNYSQSSVDVVIPTFNSSKSIQNAVDSCKGQTQSIRKIIIVDDGSDKSEVDFLKSNYLEDSQIELILNDHTGLPGVGRSIGIQKTSAYWIAFLDSDDYWSPDKIERQTEYAHQNRCDVVYTNAISFNDTGNLGMFHKSLPRRLTFVDLIETNWVINSSVIIKGDILRQNIEYAASSRVRAVEDYATWLRIAPFYSFEGINLPLTYYCQSTGSIRLSDNQDPRIFALSDFILWSKEQEKLTAKSYKKERKTAIKIIRRQYE
jgi:teichuronic acid biosynthesis glycosyltransferase TuaG